MKRELERMCKEPVWSDLRYYGSVWLVGLGQSARELLWKLIFRLNLSQGPA
jgi:hypothetical protein